MHGNFYRLLLFISMQVIKGGELDIRFELRDPLGILVTSGISKPSNKETDREVKEEAKEKDSEERREEEGERDIRTHWSYSLKIKKEGRYSLCLDNSYSVMTEKLVTFEFDSDDDESLDTFSDSIDSLLKQFEENTTQAVNPHLKDMQVNVTRHGILLHLTLDAFTSL